MSIQLYGSNRSSAARCHWLLNQIGLEYQTIILDMSKGENKTPEYLKLNPNGKVPTLIDGEFALFESMAINNYLARKYKPELLGGTLEDAALVDQWSFWALVELYKVASVPLYHKLFGRHTNEEVEAAKPKVIQLLQVLNNFLENKTFLIGEKLTVADINLGSITTQMELAGFNESDYQNIAKYNQTLRALPSFAKTFAPVI